MRDSTSRQFLRPSRGKSTPLLLAILFLSFSTTFISPSHASAAPATDPPACTHSGCDGKDPNGTGCATGATTVAEFTDDFFRVELRYSNKCGSKWARITSSSNVIGCRDTELWKSPAKTGPGKKLWTSGAVCGAGDAGGSDFTPMASSTYWLEACTVRDSGTRICTPRQ